VLTNLKRNKIKNNIEKILSQGPRTDLSKNFSKASGVALLLCGTQLELLFIKRAKNPIDHWSGQIAFPGGKRDESDASLLATCRRELYEEVSLDLSVDCLVGSLDDLQARKHGAHLDFYIRPFVFYTKEKPFVNAVPGEVEKTLWVSLDYLVNPKNRMNYSFTRDQIKLELPGIQLPDGDILWGLTYEMVQNLIRKI
jgi:8-oxo-dGTP pyrophosphatase MutT (NUDIX family)